MAPREWRWLAAIFLLALIARVGWVLVAPRLDPVLSHDPLYGDASGYNLLAANLVKGWGLTWDGKTPTSYRMPGYPAFLALVYSVAGQSSEIVRLTQAVLGALLCIPVFAIARRLGGESIAVLAGLGIALHPLLIYMSGWLYSETLFLLLLWAGLWLLVRAWEGGSSHDTIAAGMALGLATYVRPEIFAFPLFAAIVGTLLRWPRQRLQVFMVIQAVLVVMILPWTVRNYSAHGGIVLLATNTGTNLYGANNPLADGGLPRDQIFALPDVSEVESDRLLAGRALDWITANPRAFLRLLPLKLLKFFSATAIKTAGNPLGKWAVPIDFAYWLFVFVAIFGWVRTHKSGTSAILALVLGWYVLLALIFSGGTRVALPVAPALVVLAARGACELRHVWHSRFAGSA